LIEEGCNILTPNKHGTPPFVVCSQNGHKAIVELLIAKKADVNDPMKPDNNSPLLLATICKHPEVVRILLDHGATLQPNIKSFDPLEQAAKMGLESILEMIIKKFGSSEDLNLFVPALTRASQRGQTKNVQLILDKIPHINIDSTFDGHTALGKAVIGNFIDTVKSLLNRGANPNIVDNVDEGWTALKLAIREGFVSIANTLISSNANVDLVDKSGCSPLLFASAKGLTNMAKLLIQSKCDLNIADKDGMTAIHLATKIGNKELVQLLVDAGCDTNAKNKDGKTAQDLAEEKAEEERKKEK